MNPIDYGVLVVVGSAVIIAVVTAVFIKRAMRKQREAVAPPPMERLHLYVKMTDGTWENFSDKFPEGTPYMSVRGIRQFVKWFHAREQSKYLQLGGSINTCLSRSAIMYYKLTREKA